MVIERLKLLRIAWQPIEDQPLLYHAVVDGKKVQLRIYDQPEKPICTVIYGLSEIDMEEVPARWSIPKSLDSKVKNVP